ncbi:type I secretion system permease/ATPase [Atopomonas sediminilitoris]|uniref:type I secretion system permease/ATPase n=1 Tax=Atopomonas sediminilitoris TaxID=2919919 RepID=UPI001F4EEF9D|nr:type I secretion system permease/ATPase [Atopomonas sediminilitoris]MCJ8168819.1 type I secretion system permease/ATPase [Atopomonas sediminilitoris]
MAYQAHTASAGAAEPQKKDQRHAHDNPLLDALLLLCRHYERPASRASLTAGLPLPEQRLTLELLPRAADRAHLKVRVLERKLTHINDINLPVILMFNSGSCCVLLEWIDQEHARILPAEADGGEQTVTREQLHKAYSGQAVFIRPVHEHAPERMALLPRVEAWLQDALKLSRGLYVDALLASLLVNLLGLTVPLFVMQVYDRVVPNQALSTLWVLALGLGLACGFELLLRILRGYFLDLAGKKTDLVLSASIFERITGMALKARPASVGAFAQHIHDFQGLRDFLTSLTLASLIDLPFVFLMLGVIFLLGGTLVWVPLLAFPLTILIGIIIHLQLKDVVKRSLTLGAERQALLIETLSALDALKTLGGESERQHQWEQTLGTLAKLDLRSHFLATLAINSTLFTQQLAGISIIIAGVYQIIDGNMSVGALVACYMLNSRVLAPLGQIAGIFSRYQQARVTKDYTDTLMQLPQERQANQRPLEGIALKGELEAQHLDFTYPGQQHPSLQNIQLHLKPGERVGIIGRSGSGKSTLGRLLVGFYQPDKGAVLLDNIDIRQLDIADLRHHLGYVAQDVQLFSGSLRDNLTFGARYVSDARMLEVADLCGVSDFARQHPEGFNRAVGERGALLSGGQRQAVAIARSLLLDPKLLILDEPTSSMDNTSEEHLRQRLLPIVHNKTMVLITHRTSLLSLVDRLVVMDNGHIVADGPKELVIEALKSGKINPIHKRSGEH